MLLYVLLKLRMTLFLSLDTCWLLFNNDSDFFLVRLTSFQSFPLFFGFLIIGKLHHLC